VVSGTDYNCTTAITSATVRSENGMKVEKTFNLHLKLTLKLFKQYKKCTQEAAITGNIVATDFYIWLHHTCRTLYPRLKFDYDAVTAINDMFNTTHMKMNQLPTLTTNKPDNELLHTVMAHENFIFV